MVSAPGEPPGSRVSTHADAERPQTLGQHRGLGGLAGALAAFEGDEASAHCVHAALSASSQPLGAGAEQRR